jgi:hypothetical protein
MFTAEIAKLAGAKPSTPAAETAYADWLAYETKRREGP